MYFLSVYSTPDAPVPDGGVPPPKPDSGSESDSDASFSDWENKETKL